VFISWETLKVAELYYTIAGSHIETQKPSPSGNARPTHLRFQISADAIRLMASQPIAEILFMEQPGEIGPYHG
jgi:hypothetical protein